MKKLKDKIEYILKEYPETRNSDITLMIKVWEEFHSTDGVIEIKELYKLPREDHVKRLRAKFAQEGNLWAFPTEWKVAKARKMSEDKWRMALGYKPLPKKVYFDYMNKVHEVSEDKVEEFLQLNPNATRI